MDSRKWARLAGWFGVLWPCLFLAIVVGAELFLPKAHSTAEDLVTWTNLHNRRMDMLFHTVAAIVGLLGIGWCVGLNEWLQAEKPTILSKLAMVFGIAGFSIFTAMLIVQGSVQSGMGEQFAELTSDAQRNAATAMLRSLRLVDLGLDFTWDIFIAWAMILFGGAMFHTRSFGKYLGVAGILISAFLFSLDVWNAPNPAEPDLSFVALVWVVAVSIQMLRHSRTPLAINASTPF